MTLAGELEAIRAAGDVRGPQCMTCKLLLKLDADDAAALRDALGSDMATTRIARALANAGHRVQAGNLQRHRNGECRGTAR